MKASLQLNSNSIDFLVRARPLVNGRKLSKLLYIHSKFVIDWGETV